MKEKEWLPRIKNELDASRTIYPEPFASPFDSFALIREKMDGLWARIVKDNEANNPAYAHLIEPNSGPIPADKETQATQVAAMALRFLCDCCGEE